MRNSQGDYLPVQKHRACTSLYFLDFWLGHMTYFGPWKDRRCHANRGLKYACIVSESMVGYALWCFCPYHENSSQGGGASSSWSRQVEQTGEPAGLITRSRDVQPSPAQPRSANSQLADHRWVKINAYY